MMDGELRLLSKYGQTDRTTDIEKIVVMERRIVLVRWLGIVFGIVATPFLGFPRPMFILMCCLILFAIVHNVVFQFYIIPFKRHWLLKPAILTVGDITMGSGAVYVTGGMHSDFYVIYFLIAVLSAIRFGGSAAGISTLISIVMYTAIVFLHGVTDWVKDVASIILRMGFVATTGVFVGYVGDKARQVELDLQAELDKAHEKLNESTALLNHDLEVKAVLQTAAEEARKLIGAHFAVVQMTKSGVDVLPHHLEDEYLSPYFSVSEDLRQSAQIDVDKLLSLCNDLLRLSPLLQRVKTDSNYVTVAHCMMDGDLAEAFPTMKGQSAALISMPLLHGDKLLGRLLLLRVSRVHTPVRETEKNIIGVFSNRISAALTNALVFAQSRLQAITDPVTGLYNHRHLHEVIRTELASAVDGQGSLSLIVLDIDSFKLFNDTYGHSVGDVSLRSVADLILRAVHKQGFAFRFGGDEFSIVLPGFSHIEALKVAESIRKGAIEMSHVATHEALSSLSISLGVATYPEVASTSEELFRAADLALYAAKAAGKNVVKSASELSNESWSPSSGEKTALYSRHSTVTNLTGVELQIVNGLIAAVDARDQYTHHHSIGVSQLSVLLAQRLGLGHRDVERIRIGALVHDIGKIGIPDAILQKDGKLSTEEYEVIKSHPIIGEQIIQPIQSLWAYLPIVLHHHEWFNGSGYPHGLKGDAIPFVARIVSICDAYDAMTSDRPYRKAMSTDRALSTINNLLGVQFDPLLWDKFYKVIVNYVPMAGVTR